MALRSKKVFVGVLFFWCSFAGAGVISNFDDLDLDPNSHWSGNYPSDGTGGTYGVEYFDSGTASYKNYSDGDWGSWAGFAYSNEVDTTTEGYTNQYSSYAGNAHSGDNFAVGYMDAYNNFNPTMVLDAPGEVHGMYVTNTTYTALAILNGYYTATAFDEGDWFKLTIEGFNANTESTGTVDFYLADYRSGGSYIADNWEYVDLASLGTVKSLEFTLDSSDVNSENEINTPVYFAMDTAVPEPATIAIMGLGAVIAGRRKLSL